MFRHLLRRLRINTGWRYLLPHPFWVHADEGPDWHFVYFGIEDRNGNIILGLQVDLGEVTEDG